ncbi:MAG: hypothetical protein KAU50_12835, partial [Candidatus Marinimicrobia bacterium]|nr:hypothetical protein [Candidatus Neomarinimicrobiota bacterium]
MRTSNLRLYVSILAVLSVLLIGTPGYSNPEISQVYDATELSQPGIVVTEGSQLVTGTMAVIPENTDDAVVLMSSNSFVWWQRYPAEEKEWLVMSNATAYYRDVLVGGRIHIVGAQDGEHWTASAVMPGELTYQWGYVRFYAEYNGYHNAFVSDYGWIIYNTTSIDVVWWYNSQCLDTGQWSMTFYNNGAPFHTGEFTVLPEINPDKLVEQFNQGSYGSYAYDSICRTRKSTGELLDDVFPCGTKENEVEWTIQNKGCYLCAAAEILNYHGVSVTPPALNTWLIDNKGYTKDGNVNPFAIAAYAVKVGGIDFLYDTEGVNTTHDPQGGGDLENLICEFGPQIIGVKGNHHFVTMTGRDANKTTSKIIDPDGGDKATLAAKGYTVSGVRLFKGPGYIYKDMSGIIVDFHSPGDLLIENSEGLK